MASYIETAQQGLCLLEEAILAALAEHKDGLYNNELARLLQIESNYEGKQANYLSYSILGGLLRNGRIVKEKRGSRTFYMRTPAL